MNRGSPQNFRISAGFLFLVALFVSIPCLKAESYQEALIQRAAKLSLSEHPEWRALLHFSEAGGEESLINNAGFFLSKRGHTDPESELRETVLSFFAPSHRRIRDQHPQCAYIGRYHFLNSIFNFDVAKMPSVPCPGYDSWNEALNASVVTLVFSAAFLNNPASMFGHTFIRLDTSTQGPAPLNYAANYSAALEGDPGIIFAIKGIFGGYDGYFSVEPYYEKIKTYNDYENRDLWEYTLSLTTDEVARLIRHLWELQGIGSPYYYFDQNCSFELLNLLDVARPALQMKDKFSSWVIPSDTLHAVVSEPSLIRSITYRPAPPTKIRYQLQRVEEKYHPVVRGILALSERSVEALLQEVPKETQSAVLEIATDYLEYERVRRSLSRDQSVGRFRKLLESRSKRSGKVLPTPSEQEASPPHKGHASQRVSSVVGTSRNADWLGLIYRGAYHSLLDPATGFLPGSEIELMKTEVRQYIGGRSERNNLSLQQVTLLNVTSLSERDELIRPLSWRGTIEIERLPTPRADKNDMNLPFVGSATIGLGYMHKLSNRLSFYEILDMRAEYTSHLADNAAGGGGVSLGLLATVSERSRIHLSGNAVRLLGGESYNRTALQLKVSYDLSRNQAIELGAGWRNHASQTGARGTAAWHFYF